MAQDKEERILAVIESYVASAVYEHVAGTTTTKCTITLNQGTISTGESDSYTVQRYDQTVQERLAKINAMSKLRPMFTNMVEKSKARLYAKNPQ